MGCCFQRVCSFTHVQLTRAACKGSTYIYLNHSRFGSYTKPYHDIDFILVYRAALTGVLKACFYKWIMCISPRLTVSLRPYQLKTQ